MWQPYIKKSKPQSPPLCVTLYTVCVLTLEQFPETLRSISKGEEVLIAVIEQSADTKTKSSWDE